LQAGTTKTVAQNVLRKDRTAGTEKCNFRHGELLSSRRGWIARKIYQYRADNSRKKDGLVRLLICKTQAQRKDFRGERRGFLDWGMGDSISN
jgi:hypothetical protein